MKTTSCLSLIVALVVLIGGTSAPTVARQAAPTVALTAGMVIERSVRVRPGTYRLPSAALDRPAIVVRGNDIAVDMTGVTLEGANPRADPDAFAGTGVLIEGQTGVTIRGGTIRGYRIGVLARRAPRLHLTGLDVSHNWKPRLKSGYEREHQSDWLYFHNNEKEEWLRYGAGIYLEQADDAEIDHVRAVQGMNGLLASRSARLTIWNNTFSYLSGLGIGLYRVSDSRIMHNRLDWCVRGYSHGFYYRGQDSSALLMYEQTSRNVVAYNSMTHGGDGVFLWAGQSTMDTGQGGANDNLFYGNDVSHAVANGFELTFSRNTVVRNRIDDSWHGIWGGYSFDSPIVNNTFTGNDEAIAIEHGQDIDIRNNRFADGGVGIRLWANAAQDPSWGYPKTRDTRSRNYVIAANEFTGLKTAIDVMRTQAIRLQANRFSAVGEEVRQGLEVLGLERSEAATPGAEGVAPTPMERGANAMLPSGARRGRATIIVDEWGPYDYRSPKIWPSGRLDARPLTLRVLGPEGRWRLVSIRGARAAQQTGVVPGEITLRPAEPALDIAVELEYTGREVVTPRGQVIPAGTPSRFSYARFDPEIGWAVNFWKLPADAGEVPARETFAAIVKTPPVRTETLTRLGFANARSFGDGFTSRIAVTAEGSVTLPPGRYELVVTSDDGIRLWLDDTLVLEDWTIHGPKEDRVALSGGTHRLRVEYFQNAGAAALQVVIVR